MLSDLVQYGSQDIYLSGNPKITFYKTTYKYYTNFIIQMLDTPTTPIRKDNKRKYEQPSDL